jgi:hypothetical protein
MGYDQGMVTGREQVSLSPESLTSARTCLPGPREHPAVSIRLEN